MAHLSQDTKCALSSNQSAHQLVHMAEMNQQLTCAATETPNGLVASLLTSLLLTLYITL